MTIPAERTRSIIWTRQFLRDIQGDDNLPEKMRRRAEVLLRHFPTGGDLFLAASMMPNWWSEPKEVSE
jgi:hypothetical protein